jgi:hypothetical protein
MVNKVKKNIKNGKKKTIPKHIQANTLNIRIGRDTEVTPLKVN